MRTLAVTLGCLLLALAPSRTCLADDSNVPANGSPPAPAPAPRPPGPPALDPRQQYARQDKSLALALTLEALCPLAGAGVLYAGDTDKALVLGGLSLLAIGAGVGSGFALVYLGNQHPTGAERVVLDAEQGTAVGVLVVAAVSYVILRVSGLVLAPRTVATFNAELQERLGIPPAEPLLPTHALAPGLSLKLRF